MPLPDTKSASPVRTVLQTLGSDFLAGLCADINRFHAIADDAHTAENSGLEFLATRAAAQEQRKLVELAIGKTVHVNTTLKSQRDLPRWERLSPEDQQRLNEVMSKLVPETETVDAEIVDERPD